MSPPPTPQMEEEGKSLETGSGAQIQSRQDPTRPPRPLDGVSTRVRSACLGTRQGEGAVLGLHCWERLERI